MHANVDHAVLRQILLTGLGESIHFGRQFERYESIGENNVTAYFADGSSATGSVLVGADGTNSRVRRQRAPTCSTMDAGITAIYGRLPLSALRQFGPKDALEDIFLIASDQRKVFLVLGLSLSRYRPMTQRRSSRPRLQYIQKRAMQYALLVDVTNTSRTIRIQQRRPSYKMWLPVWLASGQATQLLSFVQTIQSCSSSCVCAPVYRALWTNQQM